MQKLPTPRAPVFFHPFIPCQSGNLSYPVKLSPWCFLRLQSGLPPGDVCLTASDPDFLHLPTNPKRVNHRRNHGRKKAPDERLIHDAARRLTWRRSRGGCRFRKSTRTARRLAVVVYTRDPLSEWFTDSPFNGAVNNSLWMSLGFEMICAALRGRRRFHVPS